MVTVVLGVVASVVLAACTSGNPNLQSAPPKTTALPTSTTANPNLPASTAATQQAVLNVWLQAEQTLYAYVDEPPGPLRADLVAGQTTADLFPKLADYYVNPALQSQNLYLVRLKTAELNGPTSYNLGNPSVTALTAAAATVTFCTSDSGTTTSAGQPGPVTLDGGSGGASGTASLELITGSWKINTFQTTGVAKC
jgi:hypothetical protein